MSDICKNCKNFCLRSIFICLFIYLFIYLFLYLFIYSLFKVDLKLIKNPINVNNNSAYISVNKLPNNNDNNETRYLIIR